MSELKQILESLDLNTVNLKGKEYSMVASRLEIFRKHFGFRYGIVEEILVDDGKRVLMQTRIYDRDKPEIPIGVGHAEEIRGSSLVNKTSAVENCSTSSLGRALAAAAALHGGEMASVNEIEKAQNNEKNINEKKPKEEKKLTLDETIKKTEQDRKDIADGKYTPVTETKSQAEWEKIHANYMRNIGELKNQAMCMHWFNKHKDVLINMHKIVPRMYGEIEENYTKKLNSFQT
tara:strand:+ start:1431 stop:2129 length:699 start_codon:yes stop_codon:yes gene_type:complete